MNVFLNSCGYGLVGLFKDYERLIKLDSSNTTSYSSHHKPLYRPT